MGSLECSIKEVYKYEIIFALCEEVTFYV